MYNVLVASTMNVFNTTTPHYSCACFFLHISLSVWQASETAHQSLRIVQQTNHMTQV